MNFWGSHPVFHCGGINEYRHGIFLILHRRRWRRRWRRRSREGRRGKVYIVQSEANVTKRAAADVPGRCLYTLTSDDFLSEDGNIPRKSTYARSRPRRGSLQLSWQEERVAPRSLTFIVTRKWGRVRGQKSRAGLAKLRRRCRNIWHEGFHHGRDGRDACNFSVRSRNCIASRFPPGVRQCNREDCARLLHWQYVLHANISYVKSRIFPLVALPQAWNC